MKEYAIYKGEDLLVIGNSYRCAEVLEVDEKYIRWLATPSARKRTARRKNPHKNMHVVVLNDEEDDREQLDDQIMDAIADLINTANETLKRKDLPKELRNRFENVYYTFDSYLHDEE